MNEPHTPGATSIVAADAAAMQSLGERLSSSVRAGDVLLLSGELGAGKTTFTQGLARGLGAATPVTSPTFVLLIEHDSATPPLLHLDAYRLEDLSYDEGREAGLEEFFARRDAVRLIEWPSMIEEWVAAFCAPQSTWRIEIEHAGESRRLQVLAPAGREVKL
jgi:tRNA threonylcarbamoyladenosine biosynthesis protein TsaE